MPLRSAALLLAILCAPLTAEVRDLKAFFQEQCSICHGADGSGRGPGGVRLGGRNLADTRWLARQQDQDLVAMILRGGGAMPGFRRQLSEAEARRLVVQVLRPRTGRKRVPGPLRQEEGGP
jgi:mono/diheme cytochrome c family protein